MNGQQLSIDYKSIAHLKELLSESDFTKVIDEYIRKEGEIAIDH
jgi:hypothetical protein